VGWSIVNVVLPDNSAMSGKNAAYVDIVAQLNADGYEPFGTAGGPDGLVISFRKPSDRGGLEVAPIAPKEPRLGSVMAAPDLRGANR